jgi:hypothetical protein
MKETLEQLGPETREILTRCRKLSPEDQETVLDLIRAIADEKDEAKSLELMAQAAHVLVVRN